MRRWVRPGLSEIGWGRLSCYAASVSINFLIDRRNGVPPRMKLHRLPFDTNRTVVAGGWWKSRTTWAMKRTEVSPLTDHTETSKSH